MGKENDDASTPARSAFAFKTQSPFGSIRGTFPDLEGTRFSIFVHLRHPAEDSRRQATSVDQCAQGAFSGKFNTPWKTSLLGNGFHGSSRAAAEETQALPSRKLHRCGTCSSSEIERAIKAAMAVEGSGGQRAG